MRIACLLVPDLPLRAELRARPELARLPLAITSGSDARAEVVAVSREARARGVRPRSSVAHARSVCAELHVRVASPALERAARQALMDVALSFSPRAALANPSAGAFIGEASVFLDASGVTSLFHSEEGFAAAIDQCASSLGLQGSVSVASARGVALLVARRIAGTPGSSCVLPRGSEAAYLAPLPIDLLDPEDALAESLTRFGVQSVRDLLRLPARQLVHRLGPSVLQLLARARGEETESPLPEIADRRVEEEQDLEYPVDRLEPLLFVLRGLLSRLVERLTVRALACGPLDLRLELAGGRRDARRVGVAVPTRDVRGLLRLLALALEGHPPEAPVESAALASVGVPASVDQLDLFAPRGPDPAALSSTLTQLEALCGSDRVGSPTVEDDHRPDAFGLKPFTPPRGGRSRQDARLAIRTRARRDSGRSQLAVRALRPPVPAEVKVHRGRPEFIRSAVASGGVIHAAGPWRTTGRWWSEGERFALDHYDVQVADGTLLRLRFDWVQRSWQVDAVYD